LKPLHVCFLCNEYPPMSHGGVGTMIQALGRALIEEGHRVTVLGVYHVHKEVREEDKGVTVVRIPHSKIPKAGIFWNAVRLRRAIRSVHKDHAIDVLEGPEGSLTFLPRRLPFPTVVRMNGGHHFFARTLGEKPAFLRSRLEKNSFAKASDLVAVGTFVAGKTSELLGIERPVTIIPNSTDTDRFRPMPGLQEDGLIVFVGTVCEKKGIRQLIEGLPAIARSVPSARLEVAGRDWQEPRFGGSFTAFLKSHIDPAVRDRVTFLGPVANDDLPHLLARAEVVACPSHMEAFALVWLEGLACGKALVASRTGPGPEAIEDGVSGLLCDPYDPEDIAEKVVRILKDPELGERLGRAARERAVDRFSVQRVVTQNIDFYRGCIARFDGR
jgi:glycosyltransferase involved in cell wall biosynthesis